LADNLPDPLPHLASESEKLIAQRENLLFLDGTFLSPEGGAGETNQYTLCRRGMDFSWNNLM